MLYINLQNEEFRNLFREILSSAVGEDVKCMVSENKGSLKDIKYLIGNSDILSIYFAFENLHSSNQSHSPKYAEIIKESIDNFNKLIERNKKINQIL